MKKSFLLFTKNIFTYLVVFSVFASLNSCSKSYTASFQKIPAKYYAQEEHLSQNNEVMASVTSETEEKQQIPADDTQETSNLETPEDFVVSLKEMGVSEKKSEKIQKRLEKLNESLENARTESGTIDTKELSFTERLVVKKALKKADKILAGKDVKDLDDAREMQQMNRNVRIGLILILVGIVAGIFIWPVGAIVGTIGVVFLILGLLDY